jgi:signal peptidase I
LEGFIIANSNLPGPRGNLELAFGFQYIGEDDFNELKSIFSEIIGKDNIFVMGDNRNNSFDSRNTEFGLVNITDIVGRPLIILWSKNKNKICKLF